MSITREQSILIHQFIVKLFETEKKQEIAKKTLCGEVFYEPYNLYKNLDAERKSFITAEDVFNFIKRLYPEFPRKSIEYAFSIMSNGGRKMDFDLFAQKTVPSDYGKPHKTIYFENKKSIGITPDLSMNIQIDFANLLKTIHDDNLLIDHLAMSLRDAGITGREIYSAVVKDKDTKGYIDSNDLQRLLRGYYHFIGTFV